mmetsp:Transcript_3281/g.4605  ORF Transcript_3281/g.4605 Transcript_3281/m.4605 type:complete len:215 (+) Transcript_3281:134-778(+)|eukprot:CAMPEP_0184855624 /NCGR_PEP_ID=MMETSP0580-20130426/807_1 /TAXON_ID=1118495 /ORGANISM="Dactyliosolen fragilissimus" /LENGTH=214 /DNA_ID=CAMNT_0027350179 /DNA_START=100 /DNA_END=744 /DNA_ORIENTATION=+
MHIKPIILLYASSNAASFTLSPCKASHRCFVRNENFAPLRMGLFDGVKDAFGAPALERSTLDSERETPIDRWMGWNVQSEQDVENVATPQGNFVDSMDSMNYVAVSLEKPMGIIFEENDDDFGGIFVLSLKEGGVAEENGVLKPGDQLIAVNDKKVSGLSFDDALGTIVESESKETKLTLFRGTADQFYGPTGASQEWVDEFISSGTVKLEKAS